MNMDAFQQFQIEEKEFIFLKNNRKVVIHAWIEVEMAELLFQSLIQTEEITRHFFNEIGGAYSVKLCHKLIVFPKQASLHNNYDMLVNQC